MPSFSERNGYRKVALAFHREELSKSLRTRLWNFLNLALWEKRFSQFPSEIEIVSGVIKKVWLFHLNKDMDELPPAAPQYLGDISSYDLLKEHFFEAPWHDALDFLEFLLALEGAGLVQHSRFFNDMLTQEQSAYRLVNNVFVEITSEQEIAAIEASIQHSTPAVQSHLARALELLSDRDNPDYRNSVKESLSAVEAACRTATQSKSATLGAALKKIPNIHPALARAFTALYGYGSDESGVRHALTDAGERCTYADAKFMLVTCSAFVGYLLESVK